jgi:hypothetical protein
MRLAEYTGSPVEELYGPAPDFDVREYARTAVGNLREGLNLEAYKSAPLGADTLRTLSFLQAIERSTMQHLRTVLVTPTHKDARVTAFLITWAFEKFWIADVLSAILSVHTAVPVARKRNPISRFFREVAERFEPIKESLVANQIGGYVKKALPVSVDVIRYEAASATSSAAVTVGSWITHTLFFSVTQHLAARPDRVAHRRVERLCEQEPDPDLVDTARHVPGREVDARQQGRTGGRSRAFADQTAPGTFFHLCPRKIPARKPRCGTHHYRSATP